MPLTHFSADESEPKLSTHAFVQSSAAEDIMALPDISVDESEQIPQILEPLTSGVHEAVLPTAPGAAARAGAA